MWRDLIRASTTWLHVHVKFKTVAPADVYTLDSSHMPAKPPFSVAQYAVLHEAAKKARRKFKNQEDMGLALGITQASVSALLKGKYNPGVKVARHIANAVGMKLEELVGEFGDEGESWSHAGRRGRPVGRPNLEICLTFHAAHKQWSPWTVAAARAGIFGPTDFGPPEWAPKLDALEHYAQRFIKELRT